MEIYKPMIKYIAAAGLALAVALTPQSAIARENPCKTLETQLLQCQEEQRKKALTPQEQCAEVIEIQIQKCSVQYNLTIAGKPEFDQFGNVIKQTQEEFRNDYQRANREYEICALKAEVEVMKCLYSADKERKLEEKVAKAPPKKAKKKEPTFQEQAETYQRCHDACTKKADVNQCITYFQKQIAEYKLDGQLSSDERQIVWKVRRSCIRERLKIRDGCLKEKKCVDPQPKGLGLRFRGTGLEGELDLK